MVSDVVVVDELWSNAGSALQTDAAEWSVVMKVFMELPYDPAGYGDFGVSYIGTDAKVQFQYRCDHIDRIAELRFVFCLPIRVNGEQENLPYDRVMVREEHTGFDKGFTRFSLMLRGSDFQFEILAKECHFTPDIQYAELISED